MAFITLQQMYDAWKRVQDWVSGANTDKPKVTVDNFPETQNVQLTGSSVADTQAVPVRNVSRTVEETLVNAMTVAAGANTGAIDMGITTESEVWLMISIDQQPWTLRTNVPGGTLTSYGSSSTFPQYQNANTTHGIQSAAHALYLGIRVSNVHGLTSPTTMQEARQFLTPPVPGVSLRVDNNSEETATVTVKIRRIWR